MMHVGSEKLYILFQPLELLIFSFITFSRYVLLKNVSGCGFRKAMVRCRAGGSAPTVARVVVGVVVVAVVGWWCSGGGWWCRTLEGYL